MKVDLKSGLLATCLVLGCSMSVNADSFKSTDLNGDGGISYEEYRLRMVETYFFLDANKDGRLTPDEIDEAERSAIPGADLNGDEEISLDEYLNHRRAHFRIADSDDDGTLTQDEVAPFN